MAVRSFLLVNDHCARSLNHMRERERMHDHVIECVLFYVDSNLHFTLINALSIIFCIYIIYMYLKRFSIGLEIWPSSSCVQIRVEERLTHL